MLALPLRAEETKNGVAVQTVEDTEVRKEPTDDAPSYGLLPAGTVLTLRGQREGEYLSIKVELEGGNLEGWIRRDAIARDSFDQGDDEEKPKKKTRRRRRSDDEGDDNGGRGDEDRPEGGGERLHPRRVKVPRDEGLLLRRENSFFFGLQLDGGMAIMADSVNTYMGPSVSAGAHLGFFLTQNLPVRLAVAYSLLSGSQRGTATTGGTGSGTGSGNGSNVAIPQPTSVAFGFLDSSAELQYNIEQFHLLGFLQYSYGVSLSDLPSELSTQIGTAADLSSIWVGLGIGYVIPVSDLMDIALRLRYGVSLARSPVGFQNISLGICLEFKG